MIPVCIDLKFRTSTRSVTEGLLGILVFRKQCETCGNMRGIGILRKYWKACNPAWGQRGAAEVADWANEEDEEEPEVPATAPALSAPAAGAFAGRREATRVTTAGP